MQSLSDVAKELEKELEEYNCVLYPPELVSGGMKVDGNLQQWNIQAYIDEEFLAIKDLAKMIYETNQNITFMEIMLPKAGVEIACICRRGKILFRYVEAHEAQSDRILKRIDVLMRRKS